MSNIKLQTLDISQEQVVVDVAELWNAACGPEFAVTPRFVTFTLFPTVGFIKEGCLALIDGQKAGFVIASTYMDNPPASFPLPELKIGWVDAIAVHPRFQHRGVGTMLLGWAEEWLKSHHCGAINLGASFNWFIPGLASEMTSLGFFQKHGYENPQDAYVWDVARDLGDGKPITRRPPPADGRICPAGPEDIAALREFLWREFPGGWALMYEDFVRMDGRMSDIVVLWMKERIEGFAWVTFTDSCRPLDRYYMYKLPKPWGQLGPIGVSAAVRGGGWGGAVLQAGLEHLHDAGVRGCVIDWTGLVDFYGKYGFTKYRQYRMMNKKPG